MSMNWSPAGDFLLVADGTQQVTVKPRDDGDYIVDNVLFESLKDSEVAKSNGRYHSQDVRVHLAVSDVHDRLEPGDVIQDSNGEEYTIIVATKATLCDRWDCVTRSIAGMAAMTSGLAGLTDFDRFKIQQATVSKGDHGAHEQVWTDLHTDVQAVMTRESAMAEGVHGNVINNRSYVMYLREVIDMRHTHRVVDSNGVAYRIKSYSDPEQIGVLAKMELERWR